MGQGRLRVVEVVDEEVRVTGRRKKEEEVRRK